jgi:ubiquinone/menaquinone biosynthesis C-methylase UbiE
MGRLLNTDEVRSFYNRFGRRLDSQQFYENPALEQLKVHGRFDTAHAVFEFGCGTGRFAEQLLREHLPNHCRYVGVDVSPVMVRITSDRLKEWKNKAEVFLSDGSMNVEVAAGTFDRFVSTYVLDLLSEENIQYLFSEAYRVLSHGGIVCLTSLTTGRTLLSRIVSTAWKIIHTISPQLLGGCRPINLEMFLPGIQWNKEFKTVVTKLGISSEVIVARKIG